jgi:hypothetical protein
MALAAGRRPELELTSLFDLLTPILSGDPLDFSSISYRSKVMLV